MLQQQTFTCWAVYKILHPIEQPQHFNKLMGDTSRYKTLFSQNANTTFYFEMIQSSADATFNQPLIVKSASISSYTKYQLHKVFRNNYPNSVY